MTTLLALVVGLASAAVPPGMDAVDRGDAAWAAGDRVGARDAWREAATSAHPATAAMAEARLLQVSGNPGLVVHGPRMDAALARCPRSTEWCAVAHFDAAFFQHRLGLGPPPAPLAAHAPEAARLARSRWTTAPPPHVPTWTLGLSPFGASGYGFGAALVLRHPDLGLQGGTLGLTAGATLSEDRVLAAAVDTPGRVGVHVEASTRQTHLETTPHPLEWRAHSAVVGPRLTGPSVEGWLAGLVWLDIGLEDRRALGGTGAVTWSPTPATSTRLQGQAVRGGTELDTITLDIRHSPGLQGLAGRFVATTTRATDAPTWRTPGWGGGTVFRHGTFLQYQAPLLVGVVGEWRQPITRALGLTGMVEGGWTGRPTAGGGAGVWVSLPPRPSAVIRLDVAWGTATHSSGTHGISTGWGTAF